MGWKMHKVKHDVYHNSHSIRGVHIYLNFNALPHHDKMPKIHFARKKQIKIRYFDIAAAVNTHNVELFF